MARFREQGSVRNLADATEQNGLLVRALQRQIDETLRSLIPEGAKVAHVGYPNHWNTGDPAIWLGTQASLDRLHIEVVYQCDLNNYDHDSMLESVGDNPILIAGGGNLGDIWPNHQRFREKILQDFPRNPVLQLPQSVWFDQAENLSRFQNICSQHHNFHILLRDRQSLYKAKKFFATPTSLCPDMAFGLGKLERPADPVTDVLWLLRSDKESTNTQTKLAESHIDRKDWIKPGAVDQEYVDSARKYQKCIRKLLAQLSEKTLYYSDISDKIAELYQKLACLRVQRGLNMLSSGQVVITDRLHGHILCCLMGIPHVVLDNNYKKISNMLSSWASSPIAIQAQSLEQAVLAARQLVNMINEKHERSTT
jgi:pyruvyl transferase EpsO